MSESKTRPLVLKNLKLFPATSEEAIDDGAIVIEGEEVTFAGPAKDLPKVNGAKVMDLGGQFVMPGMTESHAHLSFSDNGPFNLGMPTSEEAMLASVRNARVMLGSGFTNAISFGSVHKVDVFLKAAIEAGKIPGPRLNAGGRDIGATASNVDRGTGSGLSMIGDGPWELRKLVRQQRMDGVEIVKIFLDGEGMSPYAPQHELTFADEEVEAVVDEAHRRNMRVACHARGAEAVKQAVRYGVDLIGHANYVDDEAVQMLHEARDRLFVGPAIAWEITFLENCESLGVPLSVARERGYEAEVEATKVAVRKLLDADVKVLIGGDYGISIAPHGAYAKDLQYFVELFGMSEGRALLCATRDGGLAADPDGRVGTLEAGKLADMVIVDGDPLQDITVLQDHSKLTVMKGGQLYKGLVNDDPYLMQPEEVFETLGAASEAAE